MRINDYNYFSGKRVFIKSLVITIFLFLILSEIASAANLVMTTDPAQPVAGQPMTLTFQFTQSNIDNMAGQCDFSVRQNGNDVYSKSLGVPSNGIVSDTFTLLTAGQYEVYIGYHNGPWSGVTGTFDRNFNVITLV